MLRAENTQQIAALFSKSSAAIANLTTDWNLRSSFRQGETDPVFVRFNVYSNIELFVEHTGLRVRLCSGKNIALRYRDMHRARVNFQRLRKPFLVTKPFGFKVGLKFEMSSLFLQGNKGQ